MGCLFTSLLIKYSKKNNIYKKINKRDIHKEQTPNIGGVSIFFTFTIGLFFIYSGSFYDFNINNQITIFVILTSIIFFCIGLYDDLCNVSFLIKFLVQFLISSLLVFYFDVKISSFYGLFGFYQISEPVISIFNVFVIVFVINAFNLIDGVDGLASSIGIFISIIFSIIFYLNKLSFEFLLSSLIFACLVSFLFFNKPRAKIFMGDSGSLFIGYLLSYLSIKACNLPLFEIGKINPVFILSVLSYPAIDTLRVFFIRISNGNSPFMPDQNHIHHILIKKTKNHFLVSIYAILFSSLSCLITFVFYDYLTFSFLINAILTFVIIKIFL